MDDRDRRILEIFRVAIETPADGRSGIVDEMCGEDSTVRRSVIGLIREFDAQKGEPSSGPVPIEVGTFVGPYEILEHVGGGSFGDVYRATRPDLKLKTVALKIVKPEANYPALLARFELEQQMLASMEHPNVARIFDAGRAPDGRPYFVMEYVPGLPLTKFCDERRYDVEARLRLFVSVCEGVQHAHQKGVIHRDLKPSNILVSDAGGDAVPKIIDFGVAKALDRPLTFESLHEQFGLVVGTAAYMSPEQWVGRPGDVDTRSDLYALGVVLHELLVGEPPFRFEDRSYDEVREMVRTLEPLPPSRRIAGLGPEEALRQAELRRCYGARALVHRIDGDLDAIVLCCLEKDRGRRYASAGDLAADVRRHLENVPILARRPSVVDRLGKLLRRRGREIAVGTVLLATLAVATKFFVGSRLLKAQAARQDAVKLIGEAEELAYQYPERAQASLDAAARLSSNAPGLEVARAYVASRLGNEKDAIARAERELEHDPSDGEAAALLAGLLLDKDPERARQLEQKARALIASPQHLHYLALGVRDDQEALRRLDQALEAYPWNFEALWQRAVRRYSIEDDRGALEDANLLLELKPDLDLIWILHGAAVWSAGQNRETVLEDYRRILASSPRRAFVSLDREEIYKRRKESDTETSLRDYERALKLKPDRGLAYYDRAIIYESQKNYPQALDDLDHALQLDPADRDSLRKKCGILQVAKRPKEAEECYTKAIDQATDATSAREHLSLFRGRGIARSQLDREQESAADYSMAIDWATKAAAAPLELAAIYDLRGAVHRNEGQFEPACRDGEKAVELDGTCADPPCDSGARNHSNLGLSYLAAGSPAAAREHLDRAVDLNPTKPGWHQNRGLVAWLQGDADTALRDFRFVCDQKDREFACLWAWEVLFSRGRTREAGEMLSEAESKAGLNAKEGEEPIVAAIVAAFRGHRDEESVCSAARSDADRITAMYVFGCRAAAEGRTEAARVWWRRCADFPLRPDIERTYARLRLAR